MRAALEHGLSLSCAEDQRGSKGRVWGHAPGLWRFFCICGCFYNFDKSSSITKVPGAAVRAGGDEQGKERGAERLLPLPARCGSRSAPLAGVRVEASSPSRVAPPEGAVPPHWGQDSEGMLLRG